MKRNSKVVVNDSLIMDIEEIQAVERINKFDSVIYLKGGNKISVNDMGVIHSEIKKLTGGE